MKSAKRIQKQLTTEYTEHAEQTLFRRQDYSTTDTHGLTRICSGGTNTRQCQGSPQPYLPFFAAKSVCIRVYPWLKTGSVEARLLQVFRGGKTRK